MSGIGDLVAHLTVDSSQWGPRFDKSRGDVRSFSTSVSGLLSSMLPAIAAAGAAFISLNTAVKAVMASGESLASSKKLEAVLESTGNYAKLTRQEYDDLAASIQKTTNFDDDAATNAMAMLARFSKVEGDEFKRVLPLAADLAAVMGTDLSGATETLGRSLALGEDGLTKLRKAGVLLTEQQEAQIRSMYEFGDAAGAQSAILDAVEKSIGGAAERMADPFKQLENSVGDIFEAIGMNIRAFADGLFEGGLIEGVDNIADAIAALEPVSRSLGNDLVPVMQELVQETKRFADAMKYAGDKAEQTASAIRLMLNLMLNPVGELTGVTPLKNDAGVFSGLGQGDARGPHWMAGGVANPVEQLADMIVEAGRGKDFGPLQANGLDAKNPFAILDRLPKMPEVVEQKTLKFDLDETLRVGGAEPEKKEPPMQFAGQALEGSVEAYRTVLASMGQSADREQKEQTKLLRSIDVNLKKKNIDQFTVVEAFT